MIPKPELDTSKMILSPMPGSLVSVAVKPGDHVRVRAATPAGPCAL